MSVAEALNIKKDLITFWTDSTSVLWWIKGHSRHFKPFVANRIGELQAATNPERWRCVPTKENPADNLTQGSILVSWSLINCKNGGKDLHFSLIVKIFGLTLECYL